jgi:hypothetical protein
MPPRRRPRGQYPGQLGHGGGAVGEILQDELALVDLGGAAGDLPALLAHGACRS